MVEARAWSLLFLVSGHLGLAADAGLSLWHLVLLDLWILPLAFAAGDSSERYQHDCKSKSIDCEAA